MLSVCFFFFHGYAVHRVLHSFPTRRSSDLQAAGRPYREHAGSGRAGVRRGHLGGRAQSCEPSTAVHPGGRADRKSTRLNSSHEWISYAVFCLKKKKTTKTQHVIHSRAIVSS